ncbi:MAG: class I tRNA ligase family protein [Candidatus Paceibacterota bacterium]|jgi:isoleucyl-tRNA synthetase
MQENNTKSATILREEKVLEFWRENNIFSKTVSQSQGRKEFVFYEGPPTANGRPGIHHLEARAFKDVMPRYKTMQGFHVRRNAGWDTHGLPVELQIEKKLGLQSKKEIESYGIAKFNKECKQSVHEYIDIWKEFTERMGYWVDFDKAYYTYNASYIESLWNIVAEVNKKNLLYKDYKVVPWCPRCGTVLSSHELAQGYEDVKDLSIYAKFKVKGQDNTYILAWTTTPWTLPGNIALAVGDKIDYVKVKFNNEFLILAKARLALIQGEYEVVEEMKGSNLVGLSYEPLFPFLKELIEKKGESTEKAFQVYSADFVTTEDGTGVVHTAVMYGADDFELGTKIGLPKFHLVDEAGNFIKGTGFLEGRFVKEKDEAGKPTLDVDIIKYLTEKNLFFNKENYQHSYPHCWRCKTALIYYARDSWYIGMSKLRDTLVAENKKINWEPAHIKEGRFGEWVREVKDWAISRERYWGTPLPIWMSEDGEKLVVDSYETLKKYTKKSGNRYFVMRHGESDGNTKGLVSCKVTDVDHLTKTGESEVLNAVEELKHKKIDLIITSDFERTKETAEIIKKELNIKDENFISNTQIREFNVGIFDGKTWDDYYASREAKDWYLYKPQDGESCKDMKIRAVNFLYEIEKEYKNKNILIVTHEGPIRMLLAGLDGSDDGEIYKKFLGQKIPNIKNAEILELPFIPLPHNDTYELDPHRPFIDEVVLEKDGKEFRRIKEVMDVWFDSGSMPFAQEHHPFEGGKILYPADYISEAIDQTRGWFYTLLAVGTLMGRGTPFKNVICLGHLLDAKGKKMSKSLGNIIEPFGQMEKFGADAVRFWMYTVNQPGESKNYDEKTVAEVNNKVFNLYYNVLAFYELYRDKNLETNSKPKSKNILDIWILEKLNELIILMTENLNNYKLLEPARALRDFMGDLSTWYLRRSRERIKDGDVEAKQTLYYVLKTLAKLLAPFAPFTAEDVWQKLRSEEDEESVHLAEWPKKSFKFLPFLTPKVLDKMETVRTIVTLGLEARQKAGIKVRQPLNQLDIVAEKLPPQYIEIIKDELNIKNINYILKIKLGITKVNLDTHITENLKQEGTYRELVRALQDMRKNMGLTPSDVVHLSIETNDWGKGLVQEFEVDLKKVVLVSGIEFKDNDGIELNIDSLVFKVKIAKI